MSSYPTLSVKPDYPLTPETDDIVLASPKAAGYQHKRPRYSRIRQQFTLEYPVLGVADEDTLNAHYASILGAASFYYYHHGEAYHKDRAWQALTAYAVGRIVRPPSPNGRSYICIVAGTTGASAPTWTTTENATFTDGTVTWQENAYTVTYHAPPKRKGDRLHSSAVTVVLDQV